MEIFLNVYYKQGCQIRVARRLNFHNKRHRKLKIGIPMFFGTRNRLVAFSEPYDEQGCQIRVVRSRLYTTGLQLRPGVKCVSAFPLLDFM